MHFGTWLQKRRRLLHLSQEQLASAVGVSATTIRNWEYASQLPRTSLGNKTALARELRLRRDDLQAIGRGEKEDAPIEAFAISGPKARSDLIKIVNYSTARQLLADFAITSIVDGGYIARRLTRDPNEFAWIVEDDSMVALRGYLPGDVLLLVSPDTGGPMADGDDVFVQVNGSVMVRRVSFGDGQGIPQGQAVLSPLNLLGAKYKPMIVSEGDAMAMAKVACLIMRTPNSLARWLRQSPHHPVST